MQVDKTKENISLCQCMKCPSYTEHCKLKNVPLNFIKMLGDYETSPHMEKMFCAYEKSNCIHQNKGCICSKCDVHKKYSLNHEVYCTHTGGV